MFKVFHDSIELVRAILTFIKATRQGNWDLHLAALESLTKYFFALDKLKCARMVHLYLSEMKELEDTDEDVLKEFKSGNLVFNKNEVPFCVIGPDHGIEHENHWMKVSGGPIGITFNENAWTRWYLQNTYPTQPWEGLGVSQLLWRQICNFIDLHYEVNVYKLYFEKSTTEYIHKPLQSDFYSHLSVFTTTKADDKVIWIDH